MEYDLQIAITQQTLNSQLAQMWDDSQIPTVFDLSGDDDNPTVAMGAPRITVLDPLPNSTGCCPLVVNLTFPIFSQRPDKCEVLDTQTNETVDLEGHFFQLETALECVNGGVKTCHSGGAKVGHLVQRLGA